MLRCTQHLPLATLFRAFGAKNSDLAFVVVAPKSTIKVVIRGYPVPIRHVLNYNKTPKFDTDSYARIKSNTKVGLKK